jgi:hypothetical protein
MEKKFPHHSREMGVDIENSEVAGEIEVSHKNFIEKQYAAIKKIKDVALITSGVVFFEMASRPEVLTHTESLLMALSLGTGGAILIGVVEKFRKDNNIKPKITV